MSVFVRALRLLIANPLILVPGLIIGAASGIVAGILAPPPDASFVQDFALSMGIAMTQLIATILAVAYTVGMAQAAWERGTASLSDGRRAFGRDAGHVTLALAGLFVIGLGASFLANYTFGLSQAAYVFFCIYTIPAAVVGGRNGLHAIGESAAIAYRRALATLLMVAVLIVTVYAMSIVAGLLATTPLIGPLVAALTVQVVIAYFSLVVVGEYLALRAPSP
jgi:hypothetical protein